MTDQKPVAPDPFDPAALRLDQSFTEGPAVKKLLTTVPVRRPSPQDFVRCHPDPAYRVDTAVITMKDDRETYLVTRELITELVDEITRVTLFTTVNRQGVVSIWPVRLPGLDGKMMEWWRSAREGAELAMGKWVRIKANSSLGAYEIFEASGTIPEPLWPELSFREILQIAFRDFLVDRPDHPVIKRLRGQS
jgi:hypothetical protein